MKSAYEDENKYEHVINQDTNGEQKIHKKKKRDSSNFQFSECSTREIYSIDKHDDFLSETDPFSYSA